MKILTSIYSITTLSPASGGGNAVRDFDPTTAMVVHPCFRSSGWEYNLWGM